MKTTAQPDCIKNLISMHGGNMNSKHWNFLKNREFKFQ